MATGTITPIKNAIRPNYSDVITTITTASKAYLCPRDGYLIGYIQGASNGWAAITCSDNPNYFLALGATSSYPIGVCIPFCKGQTIKTASVGTYQLAFVGG